jgi:transcriptional regulator with XRE-family HTH domain
VTTIPLLSDRQIGPLLRRLRKREGLTLEQLGARVHLTRKGVWNRELNSRAITAGALLDTAHALGFTVALVPQRHPGARDTGTGWPA